MDRNVQRIGLIDFLVLLAAAAGGVWLARYAGLASGLAAGALLAAGCLVALVSFFQMRLAERERIEALDLDELNRRSGERAAMFAATDAELRPARRAREQFERVVVPLFASLLALLEAGAVVWLWRLVTAAPEPMVERAPLALAVFAMAGLVLFLLGKYAAGVAKLGSQRLLQPGAAQLLLGAALCLAVAVAGAGAWLGASKLDRYLAFALLAALGLSAAETLLNLLLEIYRPRVKGRETRLVYESRLMGLAVRPEGLIRTAAQALDYQFGFRVSETWFYHFLERAVSWLVLLQLGLLFLCTTVVIIEPGEQALLERFGRPVNGREVLDAGLHLKMPWPIDHVQRHRTRALQSVYVGAAPDADEDHAHEPKVLVWVKAHEHEEFNFLVAAAGDSQGGGDSSPRVNLLTLNIPIQFEITNLVAWARGHADGAALLQRLATREVTRHLVSADYDRLLAEGRVDTGRALRDAVQRATDDRKLGVRILFIGMQDIHPPAEVAVAYEAVVGAAQEKAAKIHAAEGRRAESLPRAKADAARIVAMAESRRVERVSALAADAAQFAHQLAAFRAAPTVYPRRLYLDTVARGLAPVRKLLIGATNTQEVIEFNLEDKIRADLLDVTLPPPAAPR